MSCRGCGRQNFFAEVFGVELEGTTAAYDRKEMGIPSDLARRIGVNALREAGVDVGDLGGPEDRDPDEE